MSFTGLTPSEISALIDNKIATAIGNIPSIASLPTNYYSVQTTNPANPKQVIPRKQWTTVVFGNADINANYGGGANRIQAGLPDFQIMDSGRYMFLTYMNITDANDGQVLTRFIREYDTTKDDFGANEYSLTAGKTKLNSSYVVSLNAGRRVALQIWHDSTESLKIHFVQYKAVQLQAS